MGGAGRVQLRSRLTLTAWFPFLAGSNSTRLLEKTIQWGLGGGSFFLVTADTVSAGLRSERLCNLQLPFSAWGL